MLEIAEGMGMYGAQYDIQGLQDFNWQILCMLIARRDDYDDEKFTDYVRRHAQAYEMIGDVTMIADKDAKLAQMETIFKSLWAVYEVGRKISTTTATQEQIGEFYDDIISWIKTNLEDVKKEYDVYKPILSAVDHERYVVDFEDTYQKLTEWANENSETQTDPPAVLEALFKKTALTEAFKYFRKAWIEIRDFMDRGGLGSEGFTDF